MIKIKKVFTRIERKLIFLLDGLNTKKYSQKYDMWLKKNGVDINGKIKYIHHSVSLDGTGYNRIHLGKNIVISRGSLLLVHDFSIEAGLIAIGKSEGGNNHEAYIMKDIIIGDNCFIGANVTVLAGTEIGNNCIVGAGSVLPGKKYPDDSIIVGNPGRVICKTTEWAERKLKEKDIRKSF